MNEQKVRAEIEKVLEQYKNKVWRQYPATKVQIAKLTELGIVDLMPRRAKGNVIGNYDAQLVIAAAEDAGGKSTGGFTAWGEGDVVRTIASALYQALHESNDDDSDSEVDANGEYDPADVDPEDEALDRLIDEVAEIEDAEYRAEQQAKHDAGDWQGDRTLTVTEAAAFHGVAAMTIYRALWRGDFPRARAIGSGRRKVWLLEAEEVEQWQPRPARWPKRGEGQ